MQVAPSFPAQQRLPVRAPGTTIRLVHHGNASPNRRIESMIEMCELLPPGYALDLYLVPQDAAYYERLKRLCVGKNNVRVLEPVPFDALPGILNEYDIGLFVPPPSTRNLDYALPNKLFEYVQARLMVVVSPLQDASQLVTEHKLGVVAKSWRAQDVAAIIRSLDRAQIHRYKQQADEAAPGMSSSAFVRPFLEALDLAE